MFTSHRYLARSLVSVLWHQHDQRFLRAPTAPKSRKNQQLLSVTKILINEFENKYVRANYEVSYGQVY